MEITSRPSQSRGCLASIAHTLCYEPESPRSKNELKSRWPVMAFLCIGLFASYYIFDIPAATEGALQVAFEGSTGNGTTCINGTSVSGGSDDSAAANAFNNNFNLLYSVYSWPNIILPFFGGYISDKLGVRLMGVVFMLLIAVGQLMVALGSSYISSNPQAAWYTMWAGRTVFGFGGESLSVVQSALVASYFQGKELAFAMGINLAFARVGSVINNVLSALIATNVGVSLAYWVGLGVTLLAVASMMAAFYLDLAADNRIRKSKGLPPLENSGLLTELFGLFCCCCAKGRKKGGKGKGGGSNSSSSHTTPSGTSVDSPLLQDHAASSDVAKNALSVQGTTAATVATGGDAEDDDAIAAPPSEEIHLSAVFSFPPVFWVLTLSCLTIYIDVLTFNNNCATFVTQKWLTSKPLSQMCDADLSNLYLTANSIMSITYLIAGFLTPFFGSVCDYLGGRAIFNVVAATAITSVHVVLGQTTLYPAAPLVVLGICYSIYASALWPSIALVIPGPLQATAYGLVTAVQNFGLAVSPIAVGLLMPDPHCATLSDCLAGWTRTEWFFVYLGCAGLACGIALNIVDCCSKRPVLNLSNAAIEARDKREKEEVEGNASPL